MSDLHTTVLRLEWGGMSPRERKRFFRRYRLIAICIKRILEEDK